MSVLRSLATRSLLRSRAGAARTSRTSSQIQQWQRGAARRYASKASETVQSNVGSDLPWLIGATVVTVPGTYLILQTGSKPSDHGGHGEHGHGDEEHEEHEDSEGGEEESAPESTEDGGAEKEDGADEKEDGGEDKSEDQEQKSDGGEEKPKSGKQVSTQSSNEGKNVPEQPSDNTISKKTADGEENTAYDETHQLGDDAHGNKTIHKPDAKGGAKRRVESKNAISLGEAANKDAQNTHDPAASSKEPEQGKMSQKQAGLSNTDTKHSTDPVADGKSVKSEGAPDTAKLQGTVDPSRPAK